MCGMCPLAVFRAIWSLKYLLRNELLFVSFSAWTTTLVFLINKLYTDLDIGVELETDIVYILKAQSNLNENKWNERCECLCMDCVWVDVWLSVWIFSFHIYLAVCWSRSCFWLFVCLHIADTLVCFVICSWRMFRSVVYLFDCVDMHGWLTCLLFNAWFVVESGMKWIDYYC